MAKTFLTSIDLAGNELMNASIHNLATAPASPKIGQIYFNTGTKIPMFWNGTAWTMFGHTTAEINTIVRGTTLAGYAIGTNTKLATGDTVLSAFGKVQGQIDAIPRGTVTSVALTVPTGLSVTGSPITSSGTLKISLTSGYSIPTTAKQGQWDTAFTNNHTHGNKTIIDKLTQGNIDVLNLLSVVDGNIKVDATLWATGGVSALGLGEGGGSSGGGGADMLQDWDTYTSDKADFYAPASLLVPFRSDALSRLTALESGSATSIVTTGSGNAITSISKSGTKITATKGAKFAELGEDNLILSYQLPSYVDDVLEFATLANFPTTGESGKIYVAINTNLTYRWTGTAYVEISKSIALGTTSSTAYRGDHGLAAYTHATSTHAPTNAQKNSDITKAEIEAKLTGNITTHTHSFGVISITSGSVNGTISVNTNGTTADVAVKGLGSAAYTLSTAYAPASHSHSAANITSGTLVVARGGTGLTDAKNGFTRKVIGTLTTSATSYPITHGLGTDVVVQVIEVASKAVVECDIIMTSATVATIQFNKAPAANAYRYIIVG